MNKATLLPVNLDNLILNQNAYFYKVKQKLTKGEIIKFFVESRDDKKAKRKFQELVKIPFSVDKSDNAFYSIDIFSYRKKPSFFKEKEDDKMELKYGLFLIFELKDYISIIRKNVSGVESLNRYIEVVDYEILSHFLITQNSKVEKIVSNSMNTADSAIQRKVAESKDLKGVYSRFGASKQIINSLRLDNKGDKTSLVLNTSRINSFDLKSEFNNVLFWMTQMIKLIDSAYANLPNSAFIDGFARPLDFEKTISNIEPTYLLLRFGYLLDDIEQGLIERCYKKNAKGKEEEIEIIDLLSKYDQLIKLEKESNSKYKSDNFQVKINQKSISISNEEFKDVILDYGDDLKTTLNKYVNNGSHFLINFDKIDHVYAHRKIFKDSRLLKDTTNFMNAFWTDPNLATITSEKGGPYKTKSTSFSKDSLFGFIEEKYTNTSKILICDDMGPEWGDFISINDDEIIFIHAKYNSLGLSASDLENVFGQVQKNLGYLELDEEKINYRKNKWLENYKHNNVKTQIKRIRKYPKGIDKIDAIKQFVERVSANPNIHRKIYIVINFISKKDLSQSIIKLQAGSIFENKGVTLQILWFVNSLLALANELNTELRIICQP